MMELPIGTSEPAVKSWVTLTLQDLAAQVAELGTDRRDSSVTASDTAPVVVAVDGRSGSGKSTLGGFLTDALKDQGYATVLLGTDDFAWHAPMFGWGPETMDSLLKPLRTGEAVRYTPKAWSEHGRGGAIQVPHYTDFVVIEGVGSSQSAFEGFVDASLWIQSDAPTARRLGIARDLRSGVNGNVEETVAFWDEWDAQEVEFFDRDRPWDRVDFVVAGTGKKMPPDGLILSAVAI